MSEVAGGRHGTRSDEISEHTTTGTGPAWGDAPGTPLEARRFFSFWIESANEGRWDDFATLLHPQVVLVDPMTPEPARALPDALERCRQQYEPFPDGRIEMLGDPFVAADEPELAYRWRFTGTNLRPIDPPGFAATGLPVEIEGASVLRFDGGRVIAVHLYFDTTEIARQLLAAPPAGSRLERVMAVAQRARVRLRRNDYP